jgi:hypothetical protein
MTALPPSSPAQFRRISHRLLALIAAAALALAGVMSTAKPARADDELIRFLLGAAAIAVIIRAIDGNARVTYIDRWTLPDACLETVRVQGRVIDVYHRGCLQRAGYRQLPQRCEVGFRTRQGHRTGYEAGCLYRAGYRAESHRYIRPHDPVIRPFHPGARPHGRWLPARCELTYRQGNQQYAGYDGRCLRQEGLHDLPRTCALTARDGQRIYTADCLRQAGYRTGRR